MNDTTLLSIKEFSDFTEVKQSTLRYYDEIGLFTPAARGANNYRYYAPFQIITLNFVNVLIGLGVPLSTIKRLSTERTPKSMIELLSKQEMLLISALNDLQAAFSIIHTYRNNIQKGLLAIEDDISLQVLDETRIVFGAKTDFTGKDSFYEEFMNFCNSSNKYRINLRCPIGGYHSDMDAFLKAPGQPERFFSLDPLGNNKRAAGKYIVAYKRGYYGQFNGLPQKVLSYAETHNLVFDGSVYIVYLLNEVSMVDPSQYLAQFTVGVSTRKEAGARKFPTAPPKR